MVAFEREPARSPVIHKATGGLRVTSYPGTDASARLSFSLHECLHVDIPEADYRRLVSIDTIVNYLRAKLQSLGT